MPFFSLIFFSTCLTLPYFDYEASFESFLVLCILARNLSDQHSYYVGIRAIVQRTDTCFIADGLEESGNHILKRWAGVIMVLGQALWLEERFLVRLRINKGETVGSKL